MGDEATVTVMLRTLGGAPIPVDVGVATSGEEVYKIAASKLQLPMHKIKVVHKGNTLPSTSPPPLSFNPGDVLLAIPTRSPPSDRILKAVTAATTSPTDEDPDDTDTFHLPEDASAWERRLAHWLQHTCKCSDLLLIWLFLIRPHRLLALLVFVAMAPVAARYDLGPVFIIGGILVGIFTNLGRRREGEWSAYSVFNPGVQRLPGELDAGAVDQQMRQGYM